MVCVLATADHGAVEELAVEKEKVALHALCCGCANSHLLHPRCDSRANPSVGCFSRCVIDSVSHPPPSL